ncbi:SAP130B, partial [Symbiodinium microadriaticum]
ANRDYLVIGSDSGKISIVEFKTETNEWVSVHCEVFGKTGCRRIVPGQFVAADPKGRALMIGAIEKQKFVYIMNRDSANRLTISSPLEAHKTETVIFSICGVDVGFDNPIFAMIELEYKEADEDPTGEAAMETEKRLTYYELDLGLNHVVRKWSEPISRTANMLLTVPGGDDGPSGVLICGENWVSYKNQGHAEVRTPLPRRRDMPVQRGLLITSAAVHKQRGLFFFMLQSELGDLYKVSLTISPTDKKVVTDVVVTVFDTLPPSTSLCITKTGLMFSASEFGNHMLLQFQNMGDDENAVVAHSVEDEELGDDSISASQVALVFTPSSTLKNLAMTDELESMSPITDMVIDDIGEEGTPQIYSLCGRGNRSTLRVLRHGVSVTEVAVSELPGRPVAVWTVKESQESEDDKYIIVSFSNATLVLSIGDNVEEITDSGFLAS